MNHYTERSLSSPEQYSSLCSQLTTNQVDGIFFDYIQPEVIPTGRLVNISPSLAGNKSLKTIVFKGSHFNEPLENLIHALVNHPSLACFTLRNYGEWELSTSMYEALVSVIDHASKLNTLKFEHMEIKDTDSFALLCDALKKNTTITSIYFNSFELSRENIALLRNVLLKRPELTIFYEDKALRADEGNHENVLFSMACNHLEATKALLAGLGVAVVVLGIAYAASLALIPSVGLVVASASIASAITFFAIRTTDDLNAEEDNLGNACG